MLRAPEGQNRASSTRLLFTLKATSDFAKVSVKTITGKWCKCGPCGQIRRRGGLVRLRAPNEARAVLGRLQRWFPGFRRIQDGGWRVVFLCGETVSVFVRLVRRFGDGALLWYCRTNPNLSNLGYSLLSFRVSFSSRFMAHMARTSSFPAMNNLCISCSCRDLPQVKERHAALGRETRTSQKWLAFCRLCDSKQAAGFAGLAVPRTHQRTQEKRQVRSHDRQ